MIVDVSGLLRGEVKRIEIDYTLSPEQMDGIRFDSDARVVGCITDSAGYMRLILKAELSYHGECARCLAPVDGVFSLDFERTVTTEGTLTDQQLDEMSDEYVVLNDGELDVDEALREELLLGFPTRLLCSEDCPGLCPHCGKPKRDGDCGCSDKEIDPRLAILKTYFDRDGE
ncbi:MAG: DUF177 domain-containing protein [Clostridia bacterium]|nr:DUF177 domain-containing protein [Clostridia bacterium]